MAATLTPKQHMTVICDDLNNKLNITKKQLQQALESNSPAPHIMKMSSEVVVLQIGCNLFTSHMYDAVSNTENDLTIEEVESIYLSELKAIARGANLGMRNIGSHPEHLYAQRLFCSLPEGVISRHS